jgi:hypothetical protein
VSEYHCITQVDLTDQKALVQALEELGYKPNVYVEPKNLYGYQGDLRKQRAHVVIPRRQVGCASNDIGFERKADGTYIMHISEYDEKSKTFNTKKFKQLYAKHRITNSLVSKSKYAFSSQKVEKDGRIRLRLRVR